MSMNTLFQYRRSMLAVIGIVYFIVCLHRHSPTVVARDLALSFNADAVSVALIAAAYFYLYSAVQPLVGYLSDTIGPRRVMTLFFGMATLGAFLFALAPNTATAFIGRALVGAGAGGIFIPSLKLFSLWYRPDRFAGLTGFMLTIGGIAGLSATLPLTYLVLVAGWRGAFIVVAVLSLVLTVLCWAIVRDAPRDKGWPSVGIGEAPRKGVAPTEFPAGATGIRRRLSPIIYNGSFRMVSIAMFFLLGVFLTFQALWGIPYLMDVFDLDRVSAGRLLMLLPLGFALGGPVIGIVTERRGFRHERVLVFLIAAGTVGWLLLFLIGDRPLLLPVAMLLLVFGFTAGGSLPMSFTITRNLFPPGLMGTAVGLMNMAPFLGAALFQPITGYLLRHSPGTLPGTYSVDAYLHLLILFVLAGLISIISAASLLMQRNDRPADGKTTVGAIRGRPGNE